MAHPDFLVKAVGRRKKSVANTELRRGSGRVEINGKAAADVFASYPRSLSVVRHTLQILENQVFDAKVKVCGGGGRSQAHAVGLSISRALRVAQPEIQSSLRTSPVWVFDSRKKERRKYGLKKSRKSPQFSKRLNISSRIA